MEKNDAIRVLRGYITGKGTYVQDVDDPVCDIETSLTILAISFNARHNLASNTSWYDDLSEEANEELQTWTCSVINGDLNQLMEDGIPSRWNNVRSTGEELMAIADLIEAYWVLWSEEE